MTQFNAARLTYGSDMRLRHIMPQLRPQRPTLEQASWPEDTTPYDTRFPLLRHWPSKYMVYSENDKLVRREFVVWDDYEKFRYRARAWFYFRAGLSIPN